MQFDIEILIRNWQFLAGGFAVTVQLCAGSIVLSLVLGTIVAVGRVYGSAPLRAIITFYIDSIRAIPLLIVLVWAYFALPLLTGIQLNPFWTAVISMGLYRSAYAAEILRAGIRSVRLEQTSAGIALGMSGYQVATRIVFPQAIVRMIPPISSLLTNIIKDSAVATVIAVPEIMRRAATVASQTYRPVEVFTTVMILYFLILFPITRLMEKLYKNYSHLGRS